MRRDHPAGAAHVHHDGDVVTRGRVETGSTDGVCASCGHQGLRVMRSFDLRRGKDKLNPLFAAHEKSYELCPNCRQRYPVQAGGAPERSSGHRSAATTGLGLVGLVLLVLVVLVEAVVLVGMASVVSTRAAVVVAVALLAVGVLVTWLILRRSRPGAGRHVRARRSS